MASVGFTSYVVDNDKKFQAAIKKALREVDDLTLPFTLIAADFYRSQKAIWQLSSAGQYPDLSPAYKKRKLKLYNTVYPILKATGKLEEAASVQNGPGNITQIEKRLLTMGVSSGAVPYAIYHQSDDPRSKIPLRKFLFIGPESSFASSDQAGRLDRWLNIMKGYLTQTLQDSGVGRKT